MGEYHALTDPTEVVAYIDAGLAGGGLIGADTETMGADGKGGAPALQRWHNVAVGLSLSARWGHAIYVPLAHDDGPNCPLTDDLRSALARLVRSGQTVWHGGHFDAPLVCRLAGIRPAEFRLAHDTMLMAFCVGERTEAGRATAGGLKPLAKKYLGVERPGFDDLFPPKTPAPKKRFAALDVATATPYAAADADDVLGLVERLTPLLDHWNVRTTYNLEMALFPEVMWMEDRGVALDQDYAERSSAELARFIAEGEAAIMARLAERLGRPPIVKVRRRRKGEEVWEEEPVKLTSNTSLAALLFSEAPWGFGLHPLKLTGSGAPSVDEAVLARLSVQEDWLGWLLECRAAAKAKGTYFDTFADYCVSEDGRPILHPNYKQFGAETGRTASSDPNVQNLPKGQHIGARKDGSHVIPGVEPVSVNTRDMLVPRPGFYFVDIDWSAIEYRIIAGFSQDPGLLETFRTGTDIHVATYALMFGVPPESVDGKQRSIGKTLNYAQAFGAGPERVAGMLGVPAEEAKRLMALYDEGMPMAAAWKASVEADAQKNRYVETLIGRKRWLNFGGEGIDSSLARKMFFAALREAVNMPVQGTAADLLKITLVRLGPWLREHFPEVRTVLTTHDSITFEVPESIDVGHFQTSVRPVVEFPWDWQPGWPAITADFVHGAGGWGSLKGDEEAEDTAPAPTVEQVSDPEPAPPAPTVELAPPPSVSRSVRLDVSEDVTIPQLQALMTLVQNRPGLDALVLTVPNVAAGSPSSYVLDGTSLGPADRQAVADATGWVSFHLHDPAALVS